MRSSSLTIHDVEDTNSYRCQGVFQEQLDQELLETLMWFTLGQQNLFVLFCWWHIQVLSELIPFLNSLITLGSLMDMVGSFFFAVVINEDIGHCFSIDDRVTIMHRCLIGSLSQVYYLLHVLSIVIFYGVFKYFLPVVGLGIIDCLIGFSASFNQFLMVDMSCTTESVKSTNCSYVRCHPGFGFFVAIWFPLSELLVCVQNISEVR